MKKVVSIGSWVQTGDNLVCEILAHSGFDWVCVDMEHGAMGIIVPMVNDATSAECVVAAAKHAPQGIRGYAFCHANEWGKKFK